MIDDIVGFLAEKARLCPPHIQFSVLKDSLSDDDLNFLMNQKFLEKTNKINHSIFVNGKLQHVEEIKSCIPHQYFYWDQGECIPVDRNDLVVFRVNFAPLAEVIQREFKARNNVSVVIPDCLWQCGNKGRQQRELFLSVNAGSNTHIGDWLNTYAKKRAIIFQIGNYDHGLDKKFKEQKVWYLPDLLSFDGSLLRVYQEPIYESIEDMLDSREKKVTKSRPEYIQGKKHAEEKLIAYFEGLLVNTRRIRRNQKPVDGYDRFPRNQKEFASDLRISTTMMFRIKKIWEDEAVIHSDFNIYLSLMDFFFKQQFDSDTVFCFYDENKTLLLEAGLDDDY